jgi:hypothetical protein
MTTEWRSVLNLPIGELKVLSTISLGLGNGILLVVGECTADF